MKKLFILFIGMLFSASVFSQTPQRINYQGVARNGAGQPLVNQSLGLRITIQDGAAVELYKETHTVSTNAFGLYNIVIGNGTPVSGSMTAATWLMGDRFIKIEMDPAGGTAYVAVGTPTQLNTVPYAFGANSVQSSNNGGGGLVGTSSASLWWGFFENSVYRGYIGSYSGKNEDVDFGTGDANTLGSLHLVIQANPKLTIDSIGRVGIGTRYPSTNLQIKPASTGDEINIGNQGGWTAVGMANSPSGPYNAMANGGTYLSFLYAPNSASALTSKMLMDGGGNVFRPTNDNTMSLGSNGYRWTAVYATNGAIQTSDERFKTNIQPITPGLNAIMQLQPISYTWKNESLRIGTGVNYGFSAQELNEVLPDLVITTTTPVDAETGKPASEYPEVYGVKYAEFAPVLVKAIQEQQAMIEALQRKIAELEKKVAAQR